MHMFFHPLGIYSIPFAAMYISTFTILAGLIASTVAIPKPASYVLHEKREYDPPVWHRDTRLDGNVLLPMRIGLTQQNLDKGHEMLMEVSMHDSPKYGQHYTAEEIIDIFAPSVESVNIVKTWLSSAGIPLSRVTQSANKQWLEVCHQRFARSSFDFSNNLVVSSNCERSRRFIARGIFQLRPQGYRLRQHCLSRVSPLNLPVKQLLTP